MNDREIHRRRFHTVCGTAVGAFALPLLAADERTDGGGLHHKATARSVILLFMSGGPSQVDTFDEKPELARLAGRDVPESLAMNVPRIKRAGLKNILPSPWKFESHGECGMRISTLLPETAQHADELCVIRSMSHRNPVHGPGECVALTGTGIGNRPGLGAWSIYALGSGNHQLPAFVTMNLHTDGMQYPQAAGWGPGFLPSRFQGTVIDPSTGIPDVALPPNVTSAQRASELNAIRQLNDDFLNRVRQSSELEARLRSYDIADELQSTAPQLFDLEKETRETHQLYGLPDAATAQTGRACLLARRMVQQGVRFIQIRIGGWDAHGNIRGNHEKLAARTDKPVAALLTDLKRYGLLDSTLIAWGGEFGRTPTMEGRGNGRDHSPAAYSVWLAGGGVSGGRVIGRTDPIGYTVVEQPVSPTDLHATILHAMGIDSGRLIYNHHGLKESPVGVTGGAAVTEVFGPA